MQDLVRVLVLLGVLQGAVLAPVLALRRVNRLANRILAAQVAAVTAMMLLAAIGARWGFSGHPHLLGLAAPLPFVFAPLLYLYAAALTRPVARFDARWLVHAVPFVADVILVAIVFYSKDEETKVALARAADAGRAGPAFHVVQLMLVVQAFAYVAATWRELTRYRAKMQGYFGDLTHVDLRWLRVLVVANAAVWAVVLVTTILRASGRPAMPLTGGVRLASAAVMFVVGYMSLWQADVAPKASAAATTAPPEKYQRNRLEATEARELVAKLEALMSQEHLYRNPSLTLPLLADALAIPAHTASQLLNVHVGKSFFVFVNGHRVAALQRALAEPANAERGVLELAFEVGFSSKSTVNDFFKKLTGTTPTAYRAKALAKPSIAKSEAKSKG